MGVEETRRRNEANMKRKMALTQQSSALAPSGSGLSGTETPPSPGAGTGAIDDLLAKLRAAKPEARDQRDRRRRARLKDRHADRVASGQKMPEMDELVKPSAADGLLSPVRSEGGSSVAGNSDDGPPSAGLESINDDEDVADQAERLLQGLGGAEDSEDGEGGGTVPVPRESIRMSRRRKEAGEDERSRRRRRRQLAMSASEASLEGRGPRDSAQSYQSSERAVGEESMEMLGDGAKDD
jgi:cytokinesis protein